MSWCPNCKTEYREGIEKCADCGAVLVSSLNAEERVDESCSLLFGDKKHVMMIEKHLREKGFSSVFSIKGMQMKGEYPAEDEEKKELEEINAWCAQNLTKEMIVSRIPGDESVDEQIYFERFDYMKQEITNAFSHLSDEYAEYITETKYSEYFE